LHGEAVKIDLPIHKINILCHALETQAQAALVVKDEIVAQVLEQQAAEEAAKLKDGE
jgi:hypothetical protein